MAAVAELHYKLAIFCELENLIVVSIAADPDESFVVHENAVFGLRPIISRSRSSPASNVVSCRIELHDRRTGLYTGLHASRALQDPDIVLLVARSAGNLSQRPAIRDLWPGRIDLEFRYLRRAFLQRPGDDGRNDDEGDAPIDATSHIHEISLLRPPTCH